MDPTESMRSWYDGLLSTQRQALVQYKSYSENIRNFLLRLPISHLQSGEQQPTDELIAELDSAIAWRLPDDTTLYCGVAFGQHVRRWITTNDYNYPAFISTSPCAEVAVGSFIKRFDRDPILLAFTLPKGFPSAPFALFTEFGGEPEMLIGRNLRFRVVTERLSRATEWDRFYGNSNDRVTVFSLQPA